jgi:hypothetical protein
VAYRTIRTQAGDCNKFTKLALKINLKQVSLKEKAFTDQDMHADVQGKE